MRKKLKITIESEGNPTQVLEANGMAAALLCDVEDKDHHGIQICICGTMCTSDLLHLHDAVEDELTNQLENVIIQQMPPEKLLKMLLVGALGQVWLWQDPHVIHIPQTHSVPAVRR